MRKRFSASIGPGVEIPAVAAPAGHHGAMEIPPLPDATILTVQVGSTAHGTGIAGSPKASRPDPDAVRIEAWVIKAHARF